MTKIPAIHFEARKIGWRQSKDGLVVSFVIHPDDVNADFAVAALGTRYMVALAKIGDDEQPEPIRVQTVSQPANDKPADFQGVPSDPERRRFSELPLPQQVALRCQDKRFREWMYERFSDTATDIAQAVRQHCCVETRAEIQPGTEAAMKWAELERDFLASTGQMAEQYR